MKIIKTTLLIGSGIIGVGTLLIVHATGVIKFCGDQWICFGLFSVDTFVDVLTMSYYPILSLFLLSLITYRMRDAVVRPWLYFTAGWIPLSMALIYITPASRHGDWLNPFVKGSVAFYLSVLYVIISAILITIVWSETNLTEKQKHM